MVTFYKENDIHIVTIFGVRGEIEPKNSPEGNGCLRGLLKTITPVRGLQILSPSRILLYYRGASFNIAMSKLVNSPFKPLNFEDFIAVYFDGSKASSL